MAEELYFSDANIRVTNAEVVIGAKTYPLAKIIAANIKVQKTSRLIMLVLAAVILYVSYHFGIVIAYRIVAVPGTGSLLLTIGVLFILLSSISNRMTRPKYVLAIASTADEIPNISLKNKASAQQIMNAVNKAVIRYRASIIYCLGCGHQNRADARFCKNCGAVLPIMSWMPPNKNGKQPQSLLVGLFLNFVTFIPRMITSIIEGISNI